MTRPNEPDITWTIPLPVANQILAWLADQKFREVADVLIELRTQAQKQIEAFQQQMQQPEVMPPAQPHKPNGTALTQ